jgi:cytoskeletal protein CcmA (bactofilin family)
MLGNKKATASKSGNTTFVSRDTVIVGDIHFSGSLDVEGLVQGAIIAQPGKDALVRIVHTGRVEGEVHSSKQLELASRGRVQGNVFYSLLEMAAGSEVNGNLTHMAADVEPAREKSPDPTVEVTEAGAKSKPIAIASAKVD